MLDNRLLKYYRELADKEGRLQLKRVPQLERGSEPFPNVYRYSLGDKSFFCKVCFSYFRNCFISSY